MSRYPLGIQTFEEIRKNDWYYVDKTALVYSLVKGAQSCFLNLTRRWKLCRSISPGSLTTSTTTARHFSRLFSIPSSTCSTSPSDPKHARHGDASICWYRQRPPSSSWSLRLTRARRKRLSRLMPRTTPSPSNTTVAVSLRSASTSPRKSGRSMRGNIKKHR